MFQTTFSPVDQQNFNHKISESLAWSIYKTLLGPLADLAEINSLVFGGVKIYF